MADPDENFYIAGKAKWANLATGLPLEAYGAKKHYKAIWLDDPWPDPVGIKVPVKFSYGLSAANPKRLKGLVYNPGT